MGSMNWEGYWTHQYKCLYNKGDCLEIVSSISNTVQFYIVYHLSHNLYRDKFFGYIPVNMDFLTQLPRAVSKVGNVHYLQ